MSTLAVSVLDRAKESLGAGLPRIAGALVLLVVGVVVVRLVVRLLVRTLTAARLDELGERWGVHDALARVGLDRSVVGLLGRVLRLALTLVVVFAALSLVGLEFLSESLNAAVLFLPRLLVALGLLLAGAVLGALARARIERVAGQMDLRGPLGPVAQAVVFALFALTAVAQLGIPTATVSVLGAILVAALALTFALAFGIGSQGVAREVSAGRYVGSAFRVGQTIRAGDVHGEIVALETASAVLRADDGRTLRVPNHLLLESVVVVEPGDVPAGGTSPPPGDS